MTGLEVIKHAFGGGDPDKGITGEDAIAWRVEELQRAGVSQEELGNSVNLLVSFYPPAMRCMVQEEARRIIYKAAYYAVLGAAEYRTQTGKG